MWIVFLMLLFFFCQWLKSSIPEHRLHLLFKWVRNESEMEKRTETELKKCKLKSATILAE